MPTVVKGRGANCRLFFWNPKTNVICKRTAPEWGQFCIYYLGFFFILMSLTACMCVIIIHYVQRYQTTWLDINNLDEPSSLSLRPFAKDQLILYKLQDVALSPSIYINNINNFLEAYQNQDNKLHQECTRTCLNSSTPCKFHLSSLGPCGKAPYGFDTQSPCVLIKLNKQSNIGVKCEGIHPADREHYSKLSLYPQSGFSTSFYPYSAQKNFLSPLVAVKVENPHCIIEESKADDLLH